MVNDKTELKQRVKALLIGCGRIGAGVGSPQQWSDSHAGAIANRSGFDLWVYDNDIQIADTAAQQLRASVVDVLSPTSIEQFQIAIICTPTPTHVEYLQRLISASVPVIICEKPICSNMYQLQKAVDAYERGGSRVVVNYTRRFQPAFIDLRSRIKTLLEQQELRACAVRYQRGFLNNASHAFDLLQFLVRRDFTDVVEKVDNATYDEFPDDPTVSFSGLWSGVELSVLGLPFVRFSLFEIDLFFEKTAIRLRDSGDTIEIFAAAKPGLYYAPLRATETRTNCLRSPFANLYSIADDMLRDSSIADNFMESVALTRWMLRMVERRN